MLSFAPSARLWRRIEMGERVCKRVSETLMYYAYTC